MENSKILEELEKEITCAICHEHYTDPKILSPCCHYYCKQCIHTLALKTGINNPFSCPECCTDTTLPQGGVDHLKPAFFINRIKETRSKLSQVHEKVETMCESCSGDKAEAFCRQCDESICAYCIQSHKKMKAFASHKIVSLDELKEGRMKNIEAPYRMCEKHEELMKIYCFNCNCLICRDCIIKDHKGHKHDFVKEAAPKVKKELLEQLDPLEKVHANLLNAVKKIKDTKSEVKTQVDTIREGIKTSFNELRQILANREQELMKETAATGTQKLEKLSAQEKKLTTSNAAVQGVIEYIKQCLEHSTAAEVMFTHDEMQCQIMMAISYQPEKEKNLAPVEKADMGVQVEASFTKDLKTLCDTKARLAGICTRTVAGEEIYYSAELGKISEFLIPQSQCDTWPTSLQPSSSYCACYQKTSTVNCTTTVRGSDYHIQCTPLTRGPHRFNLKDSPTVIVSTHPTNLEQVKEILIKSYAKNRQKVATTPYNIAVMSSGKMVIKIGASVIAVYSYHPSRSGSSGYTNCSESLQYTSKSLEYTNCSEYTDCPESRTTDILKTYGLCLRGLIVDYANGISTVYVSGNKGPLHEIIKLSWSSSYFTLQKRSGVIDAYFRGMSICKGKDELLACNSKDNSILVFTKELVVVRKIKLNNVIPRRFEEIREVSSDNHGNLYVSGSSSLIRVFTSCGQFLRSFGRKELNRPYGLCIYQEYVYVTDCLNNAMVAYTTEGEHVITFNQCGFKSPLGICADKDGFIHICDSGNKRIVVM